MNETVQIITLILSAQLSYYDPALCLLPDPVLWKNCYDRERWWTMAAGNDARENYGLALACTEEFPIGSRWTLPGIRGDEYTPRQSWVCLDRGGSVTTSLDAEFHVTVVLDLLLPYRIVSDRVPVVYHGPLPDKLLQRIEREMMERVYSHGRN